MELSEEQVVVVEVGVGLAELVEIVAGPGVVVVLVEIAEVAELVVAQ